MPGLRFRIQADNFCSAAVCTVVHLSIFYR